MAKLSRWEIPVFILIAAVLVGCSKSFEQKITPLGLDVGGLESATTMYTRSQTRNGGHLLEMVITGAVKSPTTCIVVDGVPSPMYDGVYMAPFDEIPGIDRFFSPDGRHVLYAVKQGDKAVVIIDGQASQPFDDIICPIANANSDHVAYAGRLNGHWRVYLDGQPSTDFDDVFSIAFSPNGQHLVFGARRNGVAFYIVDGKVGPSADAFVKPGVVFSKSGDHLAYVMLRGGTQFLVLDGKVGLSFDKINAKLLRFSQDGTHLAYPAQIGEKWVMVVDGIRSPEYEEIQNFCFNANGRHYAFAAKLPDGRVAVSKDGVLGPEFDEVKFLAISPDGQRFAYAARQNKMWQVVLDGKVGPKFLGIDQSGIIFSANSQHVAYKGYLDKLANVMIDGYLAAQLKNYYAMPPFSQDGAHLAYVQADDGAMVVVADGREGPRLDQIDTGSLRFSVDGNRLAYWGQVGKDWHLILDGKIDRAVGENAGGNIYFSPDNQHIAYVVHLGQQSRLDVDGVPGPAFSELMVEPTVCADGHMEYIIKEGDGVKATLARVTVANFSKPQP